MSRRSYAEADEGFLPTTAAISAGGNDSLFSFTGGKSKQLSFASREPKHESNGGGTTAAGTPMESSKGGRRASSGVHEHIVAERMRRQKMNHQFAALASMIPDITKTDKVSLLGSTIEYVQHLRGRLKALQEERRQSSSSTGSAAESSPPLDARCCVGSPDDGGGVIPTVEADVRGTTVLLRVVCREKKGALITVLKELEKHGLSVVNTNVLPLAGSSLNITITARIEDGFSTAIELVNALNAALKKN